MSKRKTKYDDSKHQLDAVETCVNIGHLFPGGDIAEKILPRLMAMSDKNYAKILQEKWDAMEEKAALCIQCAWRSKRARRKVDVLIQAKYKALEESAAIMLQCACCCIRSFSLILMCLLHPHSEQTQNQV